jgi:hypothetical protein
MAAFNYLEGDLQAYLSGQPSLLALMPASQIYASFVKASANFPCISICAVGQSKERTLSQIIYTTKRIQIDAFTGTYPGTKQIELALNSLLEGFVGQLKANSPIRVITSLGAQTLDSWIEAIDVYRTMTIWEIEYSVSSFIPIYLSTDEIDPFEIVTGLSVDGVSLSPPPPKALPIFIEPSGLTIDGASTN